MDGRMHRQRKEAAPLLSWKGGGWFLALGLGSLVVALPPMATAETPVELELILAVDVSGSVSEAEFDLQAKGLAGALRDPDVVAAIRDAGPAGVAVALVQWSSPGHQVVAVDWSVISDEDSAEAMAQRIVGAGRLIMGETAISNALAFARDLLTTNEFAGRRRVIDVSGDGEANWGPSPDAVRDRVVAAGITINGLAVANEQPTLGAYYRAHVIGGAGSFVVTATDYADFARAMRIKLIQEIRAGPMSYDPPARGASGPDRRRGEG
jgi:hypothetical protein